MNECKSVQVINSNMSFSDNQREIKERQEKLKQRLLQGDRGATFGHQYKDPCRKESELSIKCIDYQREHSWIDCKDYFDNFKNCKKFWVIYKVYL